MEILFLGMKQIIYGQVPSKSNGYRMSGHFMYKKKAVIDYEESFYLQCVQYRDLNHEGFFELYMDVYFQSNRSDIDGSLKIILDTLQKKVKAFSNDNKCLLLHIRKGVDKLNPRIEFELKFL